ncbi:transcription elongation factor TFIIS [Basidiobolus ranarum]|uniref:Transcription elongation factor TFIIS n=1 Tax=Basidiobolus ranarum TaxID=34480 RepID=A0ABR2WIC4_9FUNG
MSSSLDETREKGVHMIFEALKEDPAANEKQETQLLQKAVKIESEIFSEENEINHEYKSKIRSKVLNLKDPNNPDLRKSVILGDLSAKEFSELSGEDLASDERKKENEEMRKEGLKNTIGIDAMIPNSQPKMDLIDDGI